MFIIEKYLSKKIKWKLGWIVNEKLIYISMKKWIVKTYRLGLVKQGIDSLNKKKTTRLSVLFGKAGMGNQALEQKGCSNRKYENILL